MKYVFRLSLILFSALLPGRQVMADELLFSHSNHPITHAILIPMLQDVYRELGYQLRFQEAEGARTLKLFADNLVDGDVARLEPVLRGIDNAVPVVLLDTVQVVLYCRKGIVCQDSVLRNAKLRILVPTQDATLQLLATNIEAKLYFNSDWNGVMAMFVSGKIDYMLWAESKLIAPLPLDNANKAATTIGPFGLYHLLHLKHSALAMPVAEALEKRLRDDFNQGLAKLKKSGEYQK
ncbi:ABC transporter substrate-binding protein [Rheinheimera baltica]|uniref:ABC transporter substrate-binding protein n=1 Tax=Rheinheimera baltica TaxID=67576 RepID=UPI0004847AD9|nr:ABC transporter substrate-binding protein [Rheinheimera baltica]